MSAPTADQIARAHRELFTYDAELVDSTAGPDGSTRHVSIGKGAVKWLWAVWSWDASTGTVDLIDGGVAKSHAVAFEVGTATLRGQP